MTNPRFPTRSNISDELLSAYIDGQVTAAERQRVEQALATDAHIREQYETLRMTVTLMQKTPPMPVPRAFVLSEAQVLAAGGKVKGVEQPGLWERLFPRFMPLATAAVALLLVALLSVDFLPGLGGMGAPQPAMQEMEIAAAPAPDQAAPREMPAESLEAEVVGIIKEVEITVLVEKEVAGTVAVEKLAKREAEKTSSQDDTTTGESAMAEPDATSAAAKANAAGGAAPPPPAAAEMAEDEAEPMVEAAGASVETLSPEPTAQTSSTSELSPTPALDFAHATPDKEEAKAPAWLRPLEFLLALLFVIFLVVTILLHKQRHTDGVFEAERCLTGGGERNGGVDGV